MNTKEKLTSALYEAMKSGNEVQKRTIRFALSNIKLAEVDKGSTLDEPAMVALLQKEVKTRRETILEAEKGDRQDIIKAAEEEIAVIEAFLPKQMSEQELRQIVIQTIAEVNASQPSDMGKVMKTLLPRLEGKAPNDVASRIVKELLQKQ